ncbi:glyoxalase/bleomycin resistance/extradiol dioxygenase family protein [Chromobacterium sp. IIBBL 290-4]|uniref:VOC family protein n=1 Tax=Chromobacterium sp. IIBBL 290-4 TaxID=2953890 RepID=UPI0020B839E3|nr:VOC family protein [Chromobacterium sp. IIBBL 290-4]UTH74765.1 hypothetical protein NKT35_01235 [Chromobacterium sp. IIBBL 290-4]
MSANQVPPGVYPGLCYQDAVSALEWLQRAFGFQRRFAVIEDGKVMHAELSLGNAVFMISSPNPAHDWTGPRNERNWSQALYVHVPDPAAHYEQARAQGVEILQALKREEYGATGYLALDLEGHRWYFGDYVPGGYW